MISMAGKYKVNKHKFDRSAASSKSESTYHTYLYPPGSNTKFFTPFNHLFFSLDIITSLHNHISYPPHHTIHPPSFASYHKPKTQDSISVIPPPNHITHPPFQANPQARISQLYLHHRYLPYPSNPQPFNQIPKKKRKKKTISTDPPSSQSSSPQHPLHHRPLENPA